MAIAGILTVAAAISSAGVLLVSIYSANYRDDSRLVAAGEEDHTVQRVAV